MTRRAGFWLATATVTSILSACAAATPRPVDPPTYPIRHDAVRLDVPAPQGGWSSVDLLAFAADHNPKVAEAKARRDAAVAAGAAVRIALPITLTLTSEYASDRPRWGYGAGLDAPLDVGVRRKARVTDADLKVLQANEDYSETVWSMRSQIEHARITVLCADAEASAWDQVAALRRQRVERFNQRVASALLGIQGQQVEIAANGIDAVAAWRRGGIDLVFMDVHMPEMDGLEAARAIRRHEVESSLPRTPIIALTASAMSEERAACLAAGMDDLIAKPVTGSGLAATLAQWVA